MPLRRDEVKVGAKYLWQPDFVGSGDSPHEEVVTVVTQPVSQTWSGDGPEPTECDWWVTITRADGTRVQTEIGRLRRMEGVEKNKRASSFPPYLSMEERQKIGRRFEERGVGKACPMCRKSEWVLADGYVNVSLQPHFGGGVLLGGPMIPTAVIVCGHCGFVSHHALGSLGLLDEPSEDEPSEEEK